MKKIIFLIIVLSLVFYYLKMNENTSVNNAKQEILWNNTTTTWSLVNTWVVDEIKDKDMDIEEIQKPSFKIVTVSKWEELISLDDLSWKNLESWEIEITWKALKNVDKIDVYFINKDSIYPEDQYQLKQFKSWSDIFKYLASSNFKTLDFWLNEYTFTAYSTGSVYKVKLEINLPKKKVDDLATSTQVVSETASLNEDDLTTFNLPNLTVKKDFIQNIKCENLTEYLTQNYSYPYQNTCRDITKDKSIGFYVLRLDWDNYYYEKHYINYEKSLYWVLILDSWTWVTKDMLSDKNTELKQKTWDETIKADELFK